MSTRHRSQANEAPVTSSSRRVIEEQSLISLLAVPAWEGDAGFAPPEAVLEMARAILALKFSILVVAPSFRAASSAALRTASWPRGRVDLPPARRAALRAEELSWEAVAAVIDALLEAKESGEVTPHFLLVLPEAFSVAAGRFRLETLLQAKLDTLAALPHVYSGAFYQCAWGKLQGAAEPMRLISDLEELVADTFRGPPVWRSVRSGGVGSRPVYLGPLPRSCGCGETHPRRRADEAAASEPLEPAVSRVLAARIRDLVEPRGPAALAGGEDVALSLLVGPPRRGAPVSSSARISWRPLDLYIGRNSRLGDPGWGNPFKVGRDGKAERCCAELDKLIRTDEKRWNRLPDLRGRRLRCHCQPDQPCHADVLVSLFCERCPLESRMSFRSEPMDTFQAAAARSRMSFRSEPMDTFQAAAARSRMSFRSVLMGSSQAAAARSRMPFRSEPMDTFQAVAVEPRVSTPLLPAPVCPVVPLAPVDDVRVPSAGSLAAGKPVEGVIPEVSDISAAAARALAAGSSSGQASLRDGVESEVDEDVPLLVPAG
jgi:hypothetical protein